MAATGAQIIAQARVIQAPLLAVILLSACGSKLVRVARTGSVSAGLGPSELFPRRLRRPAAVLVCAVELCLGAGLILTARRSDMLADAVRLATSLFFLVAMCALVELRERRPGAGCGCFGDLSTRPVGWRSVVRAGLLTGAALAAVGGPALHLRPVGMTSVIRLGVLVAELLLVMALSPETAEVLVRLGYSEPCERREVPPQRVLAALRRSAAWRKRAGAVTDGTPEDMWRELCWWYVVYAARDPGGRYDIVFAVQVKAHRPAIHAAVVRHARPDRLPPAGLAPGEGSPALPSASF